MGDAERWCMLATGIAGLVALAAGSILTGGPWVDLSDDDLAQAMTSMRSRILAGAVLGVGGAGLLIWPVAAVAVSPERGVWPSLALFSVGVWVLGLALLCVAALLVATVAWRGAAVLGASVARGLLDISHLATWSVSAPIGAVAVVATTTVAVQADIAGLLLVFAAAMKVTTVAVELAGTGRRRGWNAGGWAAGTSGYATVGWFAVLLVSLW